MLSLTLISLCSALFLSALSFFYAFTAKNNNIAQVFWPAVILLSASIFFVGGFGESARSAIVMGIVVIWAFRLATRLLIRNRGKKEDFRFEMLLKKYTRYFLSRSLFEFYLIEGLLALLVATPVLLIGEYSRNALTILDYIGITIAIGGFLLETMADVELDRFLKVRANQNFVLRNGLWKYSRHPNYFGEILIWFGMSLTALSVPYGYIGLLSPVLVFFLITKASGIPPVEGKFEDNSEYKEYKKNTPVLVPKFLARVR